MDDVAIYIDRAKVLEELKKVSAFQAVAVEDMHKVAVTDSEELLVDNYYNTAISELQDMFTTYGTYSIDDNGSATFNLSMPSNYDTSYNSAMQKTCEQYVAMFCIAEWYNLILKPESKYWMDKAITLMAKVRTIINKRKKPSVI